LQEPNNEGSSNLDDVERQSERRSTREKRQPSYFKDYEVHLNNCSITSCFFTGVLDEPVSFEEAKGHPEWEAAMQEEIDALNKNQTWELVSKPEKLRVYLLQMDFSFEEKFRRGCRQIQSSVCRTWFFSKLWAGL